MSGAAGSPKSAAGGPASALGPLAGHESVGPKTLRCTSDMVEVLGPDGTSVQEVALGSGPATVYFTSGGRSSGLPVTIMACPVTKGANFVDQGYTLQFSNPGTSVMIGSHTFNEQDDSYGGFTYEGFIGHNFVWASAGAMAPAAEARSITADVISRMGENG